MLTEPSLCGVVVIDKPLGMVSKDVSRWLTNKIGKKNKIGHAGTLDPDANGVLPILLGNATRLQDLMIELPKTYECELILGFETDTLDSSGTVIKNMASEHVTLQALKEAAQHMVGLQEQVPPIFSAVKYKGTPLYKYARSGRQNEVDLSKLKRKVEIYQLQILSFEGKTVRFSMSCSKGTYVRVAAKDLAESVGTCATVKKLIRTRAAGITLCQAVSLTQIENYLEKNPILGQPFLIPIEDLNVGIRKIKVDDLKKEKLQIGQRVFVSVGEFEDM